MIPYIANIFYSFLIISLIYTLLIIYKKYSYQILNKFNLILNKFKSEPEKSKSQKKKYKINMSDRVEILKDKFGIKSTEKTIINLKFLINKPSHLITNTVNNFEIDFLKIDLKNILIDINNKNIIKSYIYNKHIYNYLFVNSDNTNKITDLDSFYLFHKNNILEKSKYKYNILLKFYNKEPVYLYIFVNNNNLIKIKKYEEYDKICELIENKNNIFLIKSDNNHFITHGGFISTQITKQDIKKIFFADTNTHNKNFDILNKFSYIKIYFYTSTIV